MSSNYSYQLCEYASRLELDDVPSEVIEWSKLLILDTLGVGLFGSSLEWSQTVADYAEEMGGREDAAVWGRSRHVPAGNAALVNGTFVHSFELDEVHRRSWLHVLGVALPPALALGERDHASGSNVLAAVIAALDVNIRVAAGIDIKALNANGAHPTGSLGHFGAAIAASRVQRLDAEATASAFGMAGSRAMGTEIIKIEGSHLKRLYSGRAAHNGVESAELARRGMLGPQTILEAPYGGIYDVLWATRGGKEHRYDLLMRGLGEDYSEILNVGIKPYPLHLHTHASTDLVLKMAADNSLDWREIEMVRIRTRTRNATVLNHPAPTTVMLAQQSIPYAVAVALIDGEVWVDQLMPERILAPDVSHFSRDRVTMVVDPDLDSTFPDQDISHIEITMKDGRRFEDSTDRSKGSPELPLSATEVSEKFFRLATRVISGEDATSIEKMVLDIENVEDVAPLGVALSGQTS